MADCAVQLATNSPVNRVGMSEVIGDLPPLMWHAELSKLSPDLRHVGRKRIAARTVVPDRESLAG